MLDSIVRTNPAFAAFLVLPSDGQGSQASEPLDVPVEEMMGHRTYHLARQHIPRVAGERKAYHLLPPSCFGCSHILDSLDLVGPRSVEASRLQTNTNALDYLLESCRVHKEQEDPGHSLVGNLEGTCFVGF